MTMPFGKYRGLPLEDLPLGYLRWLRTRDLYGRLRDLVDEEWERRQTPHEEPEAEEDATTFLDPELAEAASAIIREGYRVAARKLHPDVGGSTRKMQTVNVARELLCEWVAEATPEEVSA